MITPLEYREARNAAKEINNRISAEQEDLRKKLHTIRYEVYQPKIDALEAELDADLQKVKAKFSEWETKRNEELSSLYSDVKKVKQVFEFIDISKEPVDMNFGVYMYSRYDEQKNYLPESRKVYFNPIAVIADDKYKSIKVYIVPNRKPVKKFSLCIVGKSIFGYKRDGNLLPSESRYGYVPGINDEGANIKINIRDAARESELQAWLEKNKSSVMKEFLEEHAELESKYEEAKRLYESLEWQALYLQSKKEYYENDYHNGTETTEYKQVLSELEKLEAA